MEVNFAKGCWNPDDFEQITSLRTDGRTPFIQEENCVVNDLIQKEKHMSHNYVSYLAKEYFTAPAIFETVCSFEKMGAPLIVFTDDVVRTEDGYPAYGHHFEIVAFDEGINVWELNGTDKPIKAGIGRFPVPAKEPVKLTVEIQADRLIIHCMDVVTVVMNSTHPTYFRAGITGCEGVNRFYSFSGKNL